MGMAADTLHVPLGNWEKLSRDFALSDLVEAGLNNRIDLLVALKRARNLLPGNIN